MCVLGLGVPSEWELVRIDLQPPSIQHMMALNFNLRTKTKTRESTVNCRTADEKQQLVPPSMWNNPWIIPFLETKSKAPTPSTGKWWRTRLILSSTEMAWATHSHPARVMKAYIWKRRMATPPPPPNFGKLLGQCTCHHLQEKRTNVLRSFLTDLERHLGELTERSWRTCPV